MMRIPRVMSVLLMMSALCAGVVRAADEKPKKPEKRTDRIRVYNTKITKKSYFYPEVQDGWEDVSPAKYDVWHQPYKKTSLDVNTAFVVEAYINDPKLPFPAVGRRGVRVAFPACGDGPFVYIYTPAPGKQVAAKESWRLWGMACGEVYLVTPWGPYKMRDGTTKPNTRMWMSGTYTKEFKYKLTKAADGRDKLIVHHVTAMDFHPDERRTVIWEVVLGDWFATIRLPEKCSVKWLGSHSHWRIQAVPGKTERDKGVIMDVKLGAQSGFRVDLEKQRRFVQMHLQMYGTQWYKPGQGVGHLPFVWWEKTGSGKGWVYAAPATGPKRRYQCVGRVEAKTAGLIRVGGLPIHQLDLLRSDSKISKTLPPGRYRRLVLVGKEWKFDRTIKVDKNNQGKDVPAKTAGSEYLYLVDDLEERWFKPPVSAREKLKVKPKAGDDRWVVQEGVMILKDVKSPPPSKPAPTADAAAPKHWNYYRSAGQVKWGRTAQEAHSGKFSAFLSLLGRGAVNVALMAGDSNGYSGDKAYPAKPSAKYKYSFWAKGDLKNITVRLWAWKTDKAGYKDRIMGTQAIVLVSFSATSEWKKYAGEFVMPAEAKKFALMFQRSGAIGLDEPLGTVYIDDLSVRTDKTEVIKNGGAENNE